MLKKSDSFKEYVSPRVEWESPQDEAGVLCQSPQSSSNLGDITIGGEEGEDDGWLN